MAIEPETFSGDQLVDWGPTADHTDDTAAVTQILANVHVDLRTFEPEITAPRTVGSLDGDVLGTPTDADPTTLDGTLLSDLEELEVLPAEGWVLSSSVGLQQTWTQNGIGASNYLYVGNLPAHSNWLGAKMLCTGSTNLNVTLDSSLPLTAASSIDVSAMDYLTIVMPGVDPSQVNETASYIQLSSAANGSFDTNGICYFSQEAISGLDAFLKEMRLPLSSFTGINLAAITGVRIHIETTAAPAGGAELVVMAVRAIKSTWIYKTLDLNTKTNRLIQAVNPTGLDPAPADAFVRLVRTSGGGDPTPTDVSLSAYFNCGRLKIASTTPNTIDLILREQRSNVTNGSWIQAELAFSQTQTIASYSAVQVVNGTIISGIGQHSYSSNASDGPPILTPLDVNNPDAGWYLFLATIHDSTIILSLYATDAAGNVGDTPIWSNATQAVSDPTNFPPEQGRVGFFAHFLDYDVQLDTWLAAATAFSSFQTKIFPSHTPVDGAQLAATFSSDQNLFSLFTGTDVAVDTTTSLSGSSWRASNSLFSNLFFVEDWSHTYLDFDIFTLVIATTANQPVIYIQTSTGSSGPTPVLSSSAQQAAILPLAGVQDFNFGQWTHVTVDLTPLSRLVTGFYQVLFTQPTATEQSTWWVDNMTVGRQTIAWEMKARSSSTTWYEFRDMVNDPNGAIHIPREQRGSELQLQCRALTDDAWVSSFTLTPHYANLGRPIYYTSLVTDG